MSWDGFSLEERAAAYLADSGREAPAGFAWSDCDPQGLLRVLRENKVPLVSLAQHPQGHVVLKWDVLEGARQQELHSLEGQREEYRAVHDDLAVAGIEGVLIKSVGLRPAFPYKSDNLDVLYRPQDVPHIRARLHELGYVELKNVEEPHKYLFRKFRMGSSVSAIHVHAHVGWMVSFLDEEMLWKRVRRSRKNEFLLLPSLEDSLATALAHYFYEDKCVVLMDVVKFAHCARNGVDWEEVYRIADYRGWRDGLNVAVLLCAYQECVLYGETSAPKPVLEKAYGGLPGGTRSQLDFLLGAGALERVCKADPEVGRSGKRQLPLRIPFIFSKYFFYTKLVRDPTRTVRRKAKDVLVHTANGTKLRLGIHSQPNMLVTFSGVDGCGKTTHARALQNAFATCHLKADYLWSRAGSSGWLSAIVRLFKPSEERGVDDGQGSPTAPQPRSFDSAWRRWGWSWLTTIESLWSYLRRVSWPLLRGHVVICDRYFYDTWADWSANYQQFAGESIPARVLRLFSPKPDLAFWLDVPVETAHDRSTGGSQELLSSQVAAYQRIARSQRLRAVDGNESAVTNNSAVVFETLDKYFGGYHTMLNRFFLKNPGQWK